MPDLDEISYSREATIDAFRDYYRFLFDLYMEDSDIIEPPKGGWPTLSPEFGHLANCYWADWQSLADIGSVEAGVDMSGLGETLKVMTEGALDDVPAHVVGLTCGDRENKALLLDTEFGVIHWPESDGGGDHRHNLDDDPSFIEPVDPWDVDDHVPENEIEWRHESPAWAITGFFELLKKQFRELK
ncbi:hypothetical protein DSL72_003035 [Monilinia vaccinii-corymbosi]|uniref:Uncharacterized protein n=1 Tax=Monilinia vaccinii-corymbosi TaxID=61207 RepID=A0A8A3P8M9_9HELO|nr:hypothetical protein DSL72_003035 [Monilinia vaccinii-corymbosi]